MTTPTLVLAAHPASIGWMGEEHHTLGLAYSRHLDAPREVKVMFASRTLQEWDPTFIANVKRDGIVLYRCGPLPAPLAA